MLVMEGCIIMLVARTLYSKSRFTRIHVSHDLHSGIVIDFHPEIHLCPSP